MTWIAVGAAAVLVVAPHRLPQERLDPTSGVWLWTAVLLLRGVLVSLAVAAVLIAVPATGVFAAMTGWCVHAVLPLLSSHLGLSGHQLGDAATLFPATLALASLAAAGIGAWRAVRAVDDWLARNRLGDGPEESIIIGGERILLTAAGFRNPKVVVSAGALAELDDAELAAGLAHEKGHIRGRHHLIELVTHLLLAISQCLPGTRVVSFWLHFQLERAADRFAVERTGDPLALASAICKATGGNGSSPLGTLALGGRGSVSRRLRLLMTPSGSMSRSSTRVSQLLAVATVSVALVLAGIGLEAASAGVAGQFPVVAHTCPS